MPSTTSSSFCRPEPSSTVITPSLPTLSIASAMVLPMDSSEFAEIVPTWAIALLSLQGLEIFLISSTAAMTALSMPRFTSIGLRPEETALRPSRMMAWARTVAVVVPSPASSEVAEATSFTICAPMFSRSEEHTSELQSLAYLVCRLLLEKKKQLPREHAQIYNKQQYRLLDAQMETRLNAP